MSIGKVSEFDVKNGTWSSYIDRLEMYFKVNDVKPALQLPTLIAVMGDEAYQLLTNLASPSKPSALTYDGVVNLLKDYLQPAPSVLAERYRFRQRRQGSDESISEYIAELKKAARFCKFEANLNVNLRDQFVCGLKSDAVRQRLFAEDDGLSFANAVKIATSLEAAVRDSAAVDVSAGTANIGATAGAESVHAMAAGYDRRPTTAGRGGRGGSRGTRGSRRGFGVDVRAAQPASSFSTSSHCSGCGASSHRFETCRFKNYECSRCRRTGHLRRVCPGQAAERPGVSSPANIHFGSSQAEQEAIQEEDFHHLCLNDYQPSRAVPSVVWEGVEKQDRTSLTLSVSEKHDELQRLRQECWLKHQNFLYQPDTVYCNATFDSYLCWPPTAAGAEARQHCPPARLSDTSHFAYRRCGPDGLWLGRRPNDSSPLGWTNYTPCFPPEVQNLFVKVYDDERVAQLKFEIAQGTRYMEIAGFSLSLVALAVSLIIFSHYRSLRNNRTRIHKSLFSAMVLQVLIRLTVYIDQALVRSWSGDYAPHDNATFRGIDNMPYVCESFYILLEYAITVMFMWMFIEGLYLHNVVTANALREGISHIVYYATGWGLPVILTALWATMSALHYREDTVNTCWYGYNFSHLYWIVQGPRLGVIMINLVFLLNIMKVLIVKLRSSESSELEKIRKAVRAALVLLPLLGITNVINMTEAPLHGSVWKFALWSYSTHFLRSFQGFFIALIYCFLNGEVRQAVKKHYDNYMAMRGSTRRHRDSFFNFLSSSSDRKTTRAKPKKSDEMEFAESFQPQGETNIVQAHVKEYVTESG